MPKTDTFYLNSPDRWFTTTGQEKGQKVRSAQVMQPIKSNVGREYFDVSSLCIKSWHLAHLLSLFLSFKGTRKNT